MQQKQMLVQCQCSYLQEHMSVFFSRFAAAEPSTNGCVAHGTICIDPSVYPFSDKPVKQWYCYIIST